MMLKVTSSLQGCVEKWRKGLILVVRVTYACTFDFDGKR